MQRGRAHVVRSPGADEAGNASQKTCMGDAPSAPPPIASMGESVAMMSPYAFCAASYPEAAVPTTRQTPSGLTPWRCCASTGDALPIASSTSRALIDSAAPPAAARPVALTGARTPSVHTSRPPSAVPSRTTPPCASKRARTAWISLSGRTPTLSTSSHQTSTAPDPSPDAAPGRPAKPQRIGLNSMPMASSTSADVSTPADTSSVSSLREMFQSCSRPRSSGARSSTLTRSPRSASAHAMKMPIVPPHTRTSYCGGAPSACGSSRTKAGAGPAAAAVGRSRIRAHAASRRQSASHDVPPPAPPVSRSLSFCITPYVRLCSGLATALIRGSASRPPLGRTRAPLP